jgi:hypothetical protein
MCLRYSQSLRRWFLDLSASSLKQLRMHLAS